MTESVSKPVQTPYYLLLILLVVVISITAVCLWDVTVAKLLLHGTSSTKQVLLLEVKWEIPQHVILTPCQNVNIMFQELKQTVQISHKLNQSVLRNVNLVMPQLGEKMKPKLLVVHME